MSIALLVTDRDLSTLSQGLAAQLPDVDIQCWPYIDQPEKVEFVVAWRQPENCWQQFINLKAISSLGAGCDGLLSDPHLPKNIPITRIVDEGLAEQMAEYVLAAILQIKCRFNEFFKHQQHCKWLPIERFKGKKVTVLGIGAIGDKVVRCLQENNFHVSGWAKNMKQGKCYPIFYGNNQLADAVKDADYIVSTLPFTHETNNLLDKKLFQIIPKHTWLINVGRGQVVNEQDLLSALNKQQLAGAVLDVFQQEPLPVEHPFWQHDKVIITPHISAITDQKAILAQIVTNYKNLQAGKPLINLVNIKNGY